MEVTNVLGKDDFLKLFIAQLQNQNPLEPVEGLDFTNQLALFSNLEQLQEMNGKFDSLITSQNTTQTAMAVDFIGKQVVVAGNTVTVKEGTSDYTLRYSLADEASDVSVLIKDGDGKLVVTLNAGDGKAGQNSIQWDGTDSSGASVESGEYTFSVVAKNSDGDNVTVQTYTAGTVTGVSNDSGTTLLEVNGSFVSFADVVSITEDGSEGGSES
jgi:flagellar basal-body rod modification protein FlgD